MNYEELENEKIDFVLINRIIKGLVVGCDRSIGITIVYANDKSKQLLCFLGERAPQRNDENYDLMPFNKERNGIIFDWLVERIKEGTIINKELDNLVLKMYNKPLRGSPTAADCAFSQ